MSNTRLLTKGKEPQLIFAIIAVAAILLGLALCKDALDSLNAALAEDTRKYRNAIAVQDALAKGHTPLYR